MTALRFRFGGDDVRRALQRFADGAEAEVLRDNPRRRLLRVVDPAAGDLLVKQFRVGSGRHAWRERAKRLIGRSQAERESAALAALHAAGAPVPEPLALAFGPGGDALLVQRFLPGFPLEAALAAKPRERRALLAALGASIRALHGAGFAHGDLHQGNVWIHAGRPVLLDLQHARRLRTGRADEYADLGQLDDSLWGRATRADRARVLVAALGLDRPLDGVAEDILRNVGAAAEARADEHARSRTRRALREGRAHARARIGPLRGLRSRELDEHALAALVAEHEEAQRAGDAHVLKADARSRLSALAAGTQRVIVKEALFRGWARAAADRVRGSAALRAFRAGHGLRARGVGAALPLAWLEERRAGLPVRSLVVLEDLRPAPDALEASAREPAATALALAELALRLHRRGVDHGDLKCTNVVLAGAPPFAAKLLDLEGVRFRRRLSDDARLDALAQMNASLPDGVSAEDRRRAWARYRTALPFAAGRDAALAEVVARSLRRGHRWTGAGCKLAEPASPASPR